MRITPKDLNIWHMNSLFVMLNIKSFFIILVQNLCNHISCITLCHTLGIGLVLKTSSIENKLY